MRVQAPSIPALLPQMSLLCLSVGHPSWLPGLQRCAACRMESLICRCVLSYQGLIIRVGVPLFASELCNVARHVATGHLQRLSTATGLCKAARAWVESETVPRRSSSRLRLETSTRSVRCVVRKHSTQKGLEVTLKESGLGRSSPEKSDSRISVWKISTAGMAARVGTGLMGTWLNGYLVLQGNRHLRTSQLKHIQKLLAGKRPARYRLGLSTRLAVAEPLVLATDRGFVGLYDVYIYIYIYRERERYIYIYIYM